MDVLTPNSTYNNKNYPLLPRIVTIIGFDPINVKKHNLTYTT